MSRRRPGAGPVRAWSATASSAASCSTACGTAGRPSRSPAGWPATRLRPASAMKASIASSMPRSAAPTTAPGGTIFPGPKPNAAGAAAKADRRRASSRAAFPSPSAPRRPTTAPFQDIGKPTSCSSKPMARPSWSPTSACPVSSSSPDSQTKPPNPPLANSSPGSSPCHPSCARPSPSTTAPSSPSTTASKPTSVSKPSSAIPTAPGKRAGSRTPSDACDGHCRARLISSPSAPKPSMPSSPPTTIPHENAWTSKPQPRHSWLNCCTSNVNPPSRLSPG